MEYIYNFSFGDIGNIGDIGDIGQESGELEDILGYLERQCFKIINK